MNIQEFFAATGPLSKTRPGYAPRAQQIELSQAIITAIATKRHLFAEGPTGVGKSFAYLASAALSFKQTIIVTANISLQEQLVTKDLPAIASAFEQTGFLPAFKYALIKGRNNYVCNDMVASLKNEADDETRRIIEWSKTTKTGDMSELDFIPRGDFGGRLFVTSDRCLGDECKHPCFANDALQRAKDAQIIVTNYHMFFAHLEVKRKTGKDMVLPRADVVILDESHCGPDIARSFFGWSCSPGAIRRISQRLIREGTDGREAAEHLNKASTALFNAATSFRSSPVYRGRLLPGVELPFEPVVSALGAAVEVFDESARNSEDPQDVLRYGQLSKQTSKLRGHIADVKTCTNPKFVYFLEQKPNPGGGFTTSISAKPFRVAEDLTEMLFKAYPTVVAVSATMRVGGTFNHIRDEYGAIDTNECAVTSPFDMRANALCVLPVGPDPSMREEFAAHVVEQIVAIVGQSRGRALCLFSSHKQLNLAYAALMAAKVPYKILKQGDKPRGQLLEEFKRDTHSVLLGAASFWAGVDVPGESLSCVVVDKIPFLPPDDPVLLALGEKAFFSHSLPKAALELAQGVGRLIRTVTDRGVIVLLDPRLRTKAYGKTILKTLPPISFSGDVNVITQFLEAS